MKIGELGRLTGTKVETIRFYEASDLLPPPARTASNYRSYGDVHLRRLSFIRRARQLGISLEDVRELLSLNDIPQQSCAAVDTIAKSHLSVIERKIEDLEKMKLELSRIIGACQSGDVGQCKIIEALSEGTIAPSFPSV
jgi:DNA-binding transcriptional MerR regulator